MANPKLLFLSFFLDCQIQRLITIKSQPAKVANGDYVKLVCDVGTMENNVKWVYDGVTYFSCDPRYTNCFTNTSVTNNGYYDFYIKDDSLIMVLQVSQNKNDGNWSCYHGNDKAEFEIDNGDAPRITTYSLSSDTQEYNIYYIVQSQVPVDVLIYAVGYKGTRIIYDVKQSNLSDHSFDTTLLCSERIVYYNVTNGYGPTVSEHSYLYVRCPLKILHNMTTTTFNVNDRNVYDKVKIYYVGYPDPSISLLRIGADGIPEEDTNIRYDYRSLTETRPAFVYIRGDPQTGKYIMTLKQGEIAEVVQLNFITTPIIGSSTIYTTELPFRASTIYPRRTTAFPFRTSRVYPRETTALPFRTSTIDNRMTTAFPFRTSRVYPRRTTAVFPFRTSRIYTRKTTAIFPFRTSRVYPRRTTAVFPFRTSTIDPKKTTNPAENNDMKTIEDGSFRTTTKDETKIMDYLGVAGFVMVLLLILILVIVGVIWFIRIKRKPAGTFYLSTDSRNQAYSNPIYLKT